MTKYHTNKSTGITSVCTAKIQCRLGNESEHYPTKELAQKAYEKTMEKSLVPTTPNKKKSIATINKNGIIGKNLNTVLESKRLSSHENKTLALYAQLSEDMKNNGEPSSRTRGKMSGLHFAKEALSKNEFLLLEDMEAIADNRSQEI